MRQKLFGYSIWWILTIFLTLAIVIGGSLATQYLKDYARRIIIEQSKAAALTASIYISSELKQIEGAVKALSGSPMISPALLSCSSANVEKANRALDRYNAAVNASVAYLMDAQGMTVASSNRHEPDSFEGKSYNFRPYFQDAIKGKPARFFGLGITSGKRGFFASFPVRDQRGKIVGVVAIKKDLDEFETFLGNYPYCFFINPSGIIFLSSKPQMAFMSLWPVDKATRESLMASHQFGNHPFNAVFPKEIADGTDVVLEENNYFVSRNVTDSDGWSVVLLTPAGRIQAYRLVGVMATLSACLVMITFFGIIYFVNRSKRNILQNERKLRKITSTAQDAIMMIDHDGNISFWNEAAEKIFGYASQEVMGRHYLPLIIPQRKREDFDKGFIGFRTTGQGFAIGKTLEMEALRKDGTEFPSELSLSATQFHDQWFAVAIVRDITRRKHYEQEILSLSITDPLTGLYNRRGFITLAEQQLKIAERTKNRLLLLFADLDGMKWINDHLGHLKGDGALVETAAVLKAVFREADILARVGGDEFAVLALGVSSEDSDLLRRRLQQQIDLHNNHENRDYRLSISVGIAYKEPEIPATIDELMSRADALMYEEKRIRQASAR